MVLGTRRVMCIARPQSNRVKWLAPDLLHVGLPGDAGKCQFTGRSTGWGKLPLNNGSCKCESNAFNTKLFYPYIANIFTKYASTK